MLFQLPNAALQRETLPIANKKKATFQAPKSCFFIFPSRHSWEQALSFAGAFPHCKLKKQLFRRRKVVLYFPFQTLLGAGTKLFRCFSSCPKRHCKGTLPIANKKKNFSGPEKLFFYFPFQTLLGAGTKLCRCFSSCPERRCKGRPFQLQIRKKNNFSGPEKLFFIFPSRHSWEQALSFSGAFPAAQSAIAKGDPSNCK